MRNVCTFCAKCLGNELTSRDAISTLRFLRRKMRKHTANGTRETIPPFVSTAYVKSETNDAAFTRHRVGTVDRQGINVRIKAALLSFIIGSSIFAIRFDTKLLL